MSYHDKISLEKLTEIFTGNLFPLGILVGIISSFLIMIIFSTKAAKKIVILEEAECMNQKLANLHLAAKNASDSNLGVKTILDARDECQRGCAELAYHLNEIIKTTKKL